MRATNKQKLQKRALFKKKGTLYCIFGNFEKEYFHCILREKTPENESTFFLDKCLSCYISVNMVVSPSVFNYFLIPTSNENNRNGKHSNNRVYSLFFIMSIFLKHLWLIPNILKRQSCKIFTKLAPSPTPSRSSHRKCFVKEGVLKSFTGRHRCWSLF